MISETDAAAFCEDPSAYFKHSLTQLHSISREASDELQLAGLQYRFNQLRNAIPMLQKLADKQGIEQIETVNDAVTLLFDHAMYKSYPPSLLKKNRFDQLTKWLDKLTTHDLSGVDTSQCRGVDDWLITLNEQTPMALCHTSGTSGSFSFLPWSKEEWMLFVKQYPTVNFQNFGTESELEQTPLGLHAIYPHFRSGGISHLTANDAIVQLICGDEALFHPAYPERLSSDMMLLAAQLNAAKAKGELDQLELSDELIARRDGFLAQQAEMPKHIARFFAEISETLKGKRVFMQATSNMLFQMAERGLEQGVSALFAADSVVVTGGGGKGIVLPDDWQDTVKRYLGTENLRINYGMSELAGSFPLCEHGHYHSIPWVIPFILDPETSAPLPRTGKVTGRMAFYDLLPNSRWGGFVTGDEVTMNWDGDCPCGRTTAYLDGKIQRFSEKTGGEDKISCAAAADSFDEALDFLNDFQM